MSNQIGKKKIIKVSKFLSLILRHKPETIGLNLDAQGWAEVDSLIDLACQYGEYLNRSNLEYIVEYNDKKRFTFNQDKSKIRANQGHSIAVDLALTPQEPPEYLFHGTATRFLDSILSQGLTKQDRHHVHLSADRTTALKVGTRHGKPVVLKVEARRMYEAGKEFFLSKNNVWLCDRIPPDYIVIEQ